MTGPPRAGMRGSAVCGAVFHPSSLVQAARCPATRCPATRWAATRPTRSTTAARIATAYDAPRPWPTCAGTQSERDRAHPALIYWPDHEPYLAPSSLGLGPLLRRRPRLLRG